MKWLAAALLLLVASPPGTASASDTSILPAERRTTWNPGIPGGIPAIAAVHTTVDPKLGDGKADATAAINAAIQAAGDAAQKSGKPQVVFLPPGTFRTTSVINLNRSRVVLRGAGPAQTRIRLDAAGPMPVIRFGIIWPTYQDRAWDVQAPVPKGATSISLRNEDARSIEVGHVLQIDQQDGDYVWFFDGRYRKRQPTSDVNGPGTGAAPFESIANPGGPWRSVGQQIEVASKKVGADTTELGLAGPTHVAFERSPQVFLTAAVGEGRPGVKNAGIEDLYLTGGSDGNIATANLAYSWIRNIESDGDPATKLPGSYQHPGGMSGQHVNLLHAYRCVVRDSYFHHARHINQGGGAYGISVANASSDNLIENNIVVHLNKPIVMNASGGGNVVGYNYVDNAYSVGFPGWQESSLDGNHETFSHHDLFEGNWTVNLGSDTTHGNAGWQTFFRNYATGRNSAPPSPDSTNVRAVGIDGYSRAHNIVGNVLLGSRLEINGYEPVYECSKKGLCLRAAAVYRIGANVKSYEGFDDGTALRHLLRHGNYDPVSGKVVWDPAIASRELPASLYLREKPAFFGERPWPWVDPTAAKRIHRLPARERYEALRR